jgi:hypothetical protein
MRKTLSVRKVGGGYSNLVDHTALHVNADMFLITVPEFILAFAANPRVLVRRNFRQGLIVKPLVFLADRLVALLPQRRFGD